MCASGTFTCQPKQTQTSITLLIEQNHVCDRPGRCCTTAGTASLILISIAVLTNEATLATMALQKAALDECEHYLSTSNRTARECDMSGFESKERTCTRQRPEAAFQSALAGLGCAGCASPLPLAVEEDAGAASASDAAVRGMVAVGGIVYSPCTSYRLCDCCSTARSRRRTSRSHRNAPDKLSPCTTASQSAYQDVIVAFLLRIKVN